MKILYNLNKIVIISTVVLYVTLIFGLYAQIVLGATQVLSALILFLFWKNFNNKTKEQLYIYWTLVIIYGVFWLIDLDAFNETFIIIFGIMVIPMAIAGYFYYIINSIKDFKK